MHLTFYVGVTQGSGRRKVDDSHQLLLHILREFCQYWFDLWCLTSV